ncbi:hypothetical protein BGZ94_000722 [Podila epigama]|nr:hypothetical protein BGZ94_000722 [Podila epigama]
MQIENSHCDYDALETINLEMRKQLRDIIHTKYFKFYKLNLYGTCPFWTENHFCTNQDCSVATIDQSNIPEEWRSFALGALSSPMNGFNFQPFKSCQLKDQDFCQVDDEANAEGVYVDLTENPERFTGYSGPSAAKVWDSIYNENCFNVAQRMQLASACEQCSLDREDNAKALEERRLAEAQTGFSRIAPASSAFGKGILEDGPASGGLAMGKGNMALEPAFKNPLAAATTASGSGDEEICLEKRVFYRMISGLHASISVHICDEHFNQTTGVWGPNLECFVSRVGAHPDRLENIYFDYAILVRAVTKLSGYLKDYEFCTGNPEEDIKVKAMVDRLIETSIKSPAIFDEKAMFVGPEAQALKLEFRDHFRNITKIMDCVGCEKCRLWGKVQTSGLGTALKVLFSYNDEHLNPIKHPNLLQRTEIVALINTLNRLSESVESIGRFRHLYMEQYRATHPNYNIPKQDSATNEEKGKHDLANSKLQNVNVAHEEGAKADTKVTENDDKPPSKVLSHFASVLSSSPSRAPVVSQSSSSNPTPSPEVIASSFSIQQQLQAAGSCIRRLAFKLYEQNPMWLMFQGEKQGHHHPNNNHHLHHHTKESTSAEKKAKKYTKPQSWSLFNLLPKAIAIRVCPQPYPEDVDSP